MSDSTIYKLYLVGFPVGTGVISCRPDFLSINKDLHYLARAFEDAGFGVRETYMRDPMDALNASLEVARGTKRYTIKCVETPTLGIPADGFVPEWSKRFEMLVEAAKADTITSSPEPIFKPEAFSALYGVSPRIDSGPGPDIVSDIRAYDGPVTISDPSEDPDLADKLFGTSDPTPESSSVTPDDLDTIDRFLYTELGLTESAAD